MSLSEAIDINTTPERLRELASYSDELARAVATNPMVPPDLLVELINHQCDNSLQRNIAANPNTPVLQLLELGAEFPKELINNPVFTLLLLKTLIHRNTFVKNWLWMLTVLYEQQPTGNLFCETPNIWC